MVMAHALGLARNAARVDARKEQPLHGARQSLHRVRDARYIYGENPPNLADAWSTRTAANGRGNFVTKSGISSKKLKNT